MMKTGRPRHRKYGGAESSSRGIPPHPLRQPVDVCIYITLETIPTPAYPRIASRFLRYGGIPGTAR